MTENLNYFDYVEELLGEEISKDNHKLIGSLSVSQLNQLREDHHLAFETFEQYKDKNKDLRQLLLAPSPHWRKQAIPGQFRPLLHGKFSSIAYDFGGDEGHPWQERNSKRLLGLKRILMYAHSVVLADPLWYINQFLGRDREEDDAYVAQTRITLINYFDFLYEIKDLVQSEVVLFYPQFEHTGVGFPKEVFRDTDFVDWYVSQNTMDDNLEYVRYLHGDILELIFYAIRYGASCFVDNSVHEHILQRVLAYGQAFEGKYLSTRQDSKSAQDRQIMGLLGNVELTSLEDLPIHDIISVRQNSPGFEQFRTHLKSGFLRIESGSMNDLEVVRQAVQGSLEEGRIACEEEIRKSSLLSSARKNGGSFVIGAAAGLAMGDPTGGLGTGAVTAALTMIQDYVLSIKSRASQNALSRHYAIWKPIETA
jgi:hypothetical protein